MPVKLIKYLPHLVAALLLAAALGLGQREAAGAGGKNETGRH